MKTFSYDTFFPIHLSSFTTEYMETTVAEE